MNNLNARSGFTLLEILVVVIIVGVLASAAMPQLFRNVEFARAVEAMVTLGTVRRSIEACGMQFNNDFTSCNTFDAISMQDPSYSPTTNSSAHFAYTITTSPTTFQAVATRNTVENGIPTDTVVVSRLADGTITRAGTTAFAGIK